MRKILSLSLILGLALTAPLAAQQSPGMAGMAGMGGMSGMGGASGKGGMSGMAGALGGMAATQALMNNTLLGQSDENEPIVAMFLPNGQVRQKVGDEDSTGKWVQRGDMLCVEFPDDDEESCYLVQITPDAVIFAQKDGTNQRYTLAAGNPRGL
jgi:hypothetical protein